VAYKILCEPLRKIRALAQNFRLNFIPDKPFFIAFGYNAPKLK